MGGALGLAVALLASLDPLGTFETARLKLLDAHFLLRGPLAPRAPVVIVAIDEDSFDELDLAWPFPRTLHGQLLDAVAAARPLAIGLDLVFAEPSPYGEDDDRALANAVTRTGRVVLGAALTAVREPGYFKVDLNPPIRPVRDGAAGFGVVGFDADADAFVRRAVLRRPFQGTEVSSFDLEVLRLASAAAGGPIPLPSREFLIDYAGPPGSFPIISYHRVVGGQVRPEEFRNRIVLVGATTPVLHDVYPTPLAPGGRSGVEIHAHVLDTLWRGSARQAAPRWVPATAAILGGALASAVTAAMRPVTAWVLVMGSALLWLLGCHAAFLWGRLWVDGVPPTAALGLAYGAAVLHRVRVEQREKQRLSRFFSPAVVREIVRHRSEAHLRSSRRRLTVLFSDIRGFTSLSERLAPETVVELLREYLSEMTEVVFKHGGTVDKYIGDAIMALYNAPLEMPDHAARAVRTALEFQERLGTLAAKLPGLGRSALRCGVGIHTGEAVVGTAGSRQRLEYTAIGDTVNLASRLEGLTKDLGVSIVISETTCQEVRDLFETLYLGEVHVKGREAPVRVYTVLGPTASEQLEAASSPPGTHRPPR